MIKKSMIFSVVLATLLTSGCASYRTNSDINFDTTNVGNIKPVIPVGDVEREGKPYKIIGIVNAVIKKLTVFHPDPTREQADIILAHKAKKLGADAVIDARYKFGMGFGTWGKMEAKGTAIKIEE